MNKICMYLAVVSVGVASSGWSSAADPASIAKSEFRNSCAVCHGMDGKGGLQVNDILKTAPPNLALLAKNNGGKFPEERVAAVIDGREIVKGHGDRDMPIWGDRYSKDKVRAAEYYFDMPYKDTENFVKSRISALMDYLKSIQAK